MKRVAVLGSTGSIGTQTLNVIKQNADKLQVVSLVAFSQEKLLMQQVEEFSPSYHALICRDGKQCLIEAVKNCDVAVVATKGITALECVLFCLDNGIDVALANKEVLVCGGQLVMERQGNAKILPIDSEHCAISQCLQCRPNAKPAKILLTASGGPFWNLDQSQLQSVSAKEALQHPNWNMGNKITVDSATLMNKTLEVLEASWLFNVDVADIQIVVHRQSIVHSMVAFDDASVIGQFANPDMRLPIQIALLGENSRQIIPSLTFDKMLNLTFEPCNFEKFPCAKLAFEIKSKYSLAPTVMNAANDVCVDLFLQGKFAFTQFYATINSVIEHFAEEFSHSKVTLQTINDCDKVARSYTKNLILGDIC